MVDRLRRWRDRWGSSDAGSVTLRMITGAVCLLVLCCVGLGPSMRLVDWVAGLDAVTRRDLAGCLVNAWLVVHVWRWLRRVLGGVSRAVSAQGSVASDGGSSRALFGDGAFAVEWERSADATLAGSAHHEAAHAVVAWALGFRVVKVHVVPDVEDGTLGATVVDDTDVSCSWPDVDRYVRHAAVLVAPCVAGSWGSDRDTAQVVALVQQVIADGRAPSGYEGAVTFEGVCGFVRQVAGEQLDRLQPMMDAMVSELVAGGRAEGVLREGDVRRLGNMMLKGSGAGSSGSLLSDAGCVHG